MTKFETFVGFTGSEMERAAMVSNVFPSESALERVVKQRIARILTRMADYIDPVSVQGFTSRQSASCC